MKFKYILGNIKNPEIYKFLMVGLVGSLILLIFTIIFTTFFEIHYVISTIISFEISLIWAFFVNDKWTFGAVKKTNKHYVRFLKYNLFSLISLGIIQVVMIGLVSGIGFHYSFSQGVGIVIAFFFNFIMSKKISFR